MMLPSTHFLYLYDGFSNRPFFSLRLYIYHVLMTLIYNTSFVFNRITKRRSPNRRRRKCWKHFKFSNYHPKSSTFYRFRDQRYFQRHVRQYAIFMLRNSYIDFNVSSTTHHPYYICPKRTLRLWKPSLI